MCLGLVSVFEVQADEGAVIVGEIGKGDLRVKKKVVLPALPEGALEKEVVVREGGRKITYQKLADDLSAEAAEELMVLETGASGA